MNRELELLQQSFPFPPLWKLEEIYTEELSLGSSQLKMVGLVAKGPGNPPVTSSAVSLDDSPLLRAYFELIERVSICLAENSEKEDFVKFSTKGQSSAITKSALFPQSPDPLRWVYSRSNGVGAHINFHSACCSAGLELIERDVILRAWCGDSQINLCPVKQDELPKMVNENYEIKSYLFTPQMTSLGMIYVCGTFGFPKEVNAPFICGFGASFNEKAAQEHAFRESMQRLGFLWGEVPPDTVEFSPSPEFHLEYYWKYSNQLVIRNWLEQRSSTQIDMNGTFLDDLTFVDITPESAHSQYSVVKAVSVNRIPLYFGMQSSSESVHPIA
jgi:hypothetical protein